MWFRALLVPLLLTLAAAALLAAVFVYPSTADTEQTRPVDRVLVLKSERRMHLLSRGAIVRSYRVALGVNPVGHKRQRGDGRTPEGAYTLDWRNPQSRFGLSIHISYPNARDRADAARRGVDPGGDIMIHGVPPRAVWLGRLHSLFDWTEGCIAVSDAEIREIWSLVPNGTPIEIRP